ncbi:MAG: DUF4011 domain-containing protein [Methanobrevibacter sp.]|nr:DUF4011 domain-containing protein [Candidatus Methanovirga procula]
MLLKNLDEYISVNIEDDEDNLNKEEKEKIEDYDDFIDKNDLKEENKNDDIDLKPNISPLSGIETKIENWKNNLLDLGKRNRLINYRDFKRSSLTIEKPNLRDLWEVIVTKEKSIIFPIEENEEESIEEYTFNNQENTLNKQINSKNNDNLIITNQKIDDRQHTLRNLRNKARTTIEEQGVNVLYMAFGFVKWVEIESKKSSKIPKKLYSPILLVPIKIKWESIVSPFEVLMIDEEIVVNPAIKYKFESDYNIIIPEYNDEDIDSYLKSFEKIIQKKTSWNVERAVSISLFSFLKINIYNDFDKHRKEIIGNNIINAICGEYNENERDNEIIQKSKEFDFDNVDPSYFNNVIDADSSQQLAVLMCKQGLSFVLQGPPGTGKSQTITNIIADCLYDGKKVLFVSEKMAALDVVYNNMVNVGLGDFCLSLHSHKSNKKEFLTQLRETWELSNKQASLRSNSIEKLHQYQVFREQLNNYVNEISDHIPPLNKSIFEINGRIVELDKYEYISFKLNNVKDTTEEQFFNYQILLKRFEEIHTKIKAYGGVNPWQNTTIKSLSPESRQNIIINLPNLSKKLNNLNNIFERSFKELDLHNVCSDENNNIESINHNIAVKDVEFFYSILDKASNSLLVPKKWFNADYDLNYLKRIVKTGKNSVDSIKDEKASIFKINKKLASCKNPIDVDVCEFKTSLMLKKQLDKIKKHVSNSQFVDWHLKSEPDFIKLKKIIYKAISFQDKKNKLHDELLKDFDKSILSLDYKPIFDRYNNEYTSKLRFLNSQYRKDRKIINSYSKRVGEKFDSSFIKNTLNILNELKDIESWFDDNSNSLTSFFKDNDNWVYADFKYYLSLISIYELINSAIKQITKLLNSFKKFEKIENELVDNLDKYYEGICTDWQKIDQMIKWTEEFKNIIKKQSVGSQTIDNISINNMSISSQFIEYISTSKSKIKSCESLAMELKEVNEELSSELQWFINLFDNNEAIDQMSIIDLRKRIDACLNNMTLLENLIEYYKIKEQCEKEGLIEYIKILEESNIESEDIVPTFEKRFYYSLLKELYPQMKTVESFSASKHDNVIKEFSQLDKDLFGISRANIRQKLINKLPPLDEITANPEISILKNEMRKSRRIMPIRKLMSSIPNILLTLKPCLMMSPLSVSIFLEGDKFSFDTVIFDEASQVRSENAIGAIFRGKQVIIVGDSKQLPPTNFFQTTTSHTDYDDDESYIKYYESLLEEAMFFPSIMLRWHYRSRHEDLIAFSNKEIYNNNLITFPANKEKIPDLGVEYYYVNNGTYDRGGTAGNVVEAEKIAELVFEHFKTHPERSLGVIAFGTSQQNAIDTVVRALRLKNQEYEDFFDENKEESFFIKNLENVQGDERDTIILSIGYAKSIDGKIRMNFGPISNSGGEKRLNVAITRGKYNVKIVGSLYPSEIVTERITSDGPKLLRKYIEFAMSNTELSTQKEVNKNQEQEIQNKPFENAVASFIKRSGYSISTNIGSSDYKIDIAIKHPSKKGNYVLALESDGYSYQSAKTTRDRDRLRREVLERNGWNIEHIWSSDWVKDSKTAGKRLIEKIENSISKYEDDNKYSNLKTEKISEEDYIEYNEYDDIGTYYNIPVFNEIIPNSSVCFSITEAIQKIILNEHPIHIMRLSKMISIYLRQTRVTPTTQKQVASQITENRLGTIHDNFVYLNTTNESPIMPKIPNIRPIDRISPSELMEGMFIVADRYYGHTKESLLHETARLFGFKRIGDKISKILDEVFRELISTDRIIFKDGVIKTQTLEIMKNTIDDLESRYQSKTKITRKIIKEQFYSTQEKYDRFINEVNRLNDTFLKENNSALKIISMAQGHTKTVVDELKNKIHRINCIIEKIENFTIGIEIIQNYEDLLHDLNLKYQNKEDDAKKMIKKCFPPPQMTYDRFIDEINSCNEIFITQIEIISNILNTSPGDIKKVDNELKSRFDTLKSIVEKMDNLSVELTLNLGTSKSSNGEVENLLDEMQKVIDSVKDYDY